MGRLQGATGVALETTRDLMRPAAPELPVALLGHPVCASQMAVVDAASAVRLSPWTDAEKNLGRFPPVCSICLCVQQTSIEFDVLSVIFGERQHGRGFVEEINCGH